MAAVALHNYRMKSKPSVIGGHRYCPTDYVDFDTPTGTQPCAWRDEVTGDANLILLRQQAVTCTQEMLKK